ncbi:MAG TPA: glycogen debranching enzyme, partial [bacterium]|nr:glycogen debranching enzyme [bacterium]
CLVEEAGGRALLMLFNAGPGAAEFTLPPAPPQGAWRVAVDTARAAPADLFAPGSEPLCQDQRALRLEGRSAAVLLA